MRIAPAGTIFILFLQSCAPFSKVDDFTFDGRPVHPGAVELLVGILADPVSPIAAVDLEAWAKCEDFIPADEKSGHLEYRRSDRESFRYEVAGRTASGTFVLITHSWGGGSGVFQELLYARLERDHAVEADQVRHRTVLRSVGGLFLGDRETPDVRVVGNKVFVGPSRGWFKNWTGTVEFDVN